MRNLCGLLTLAALSAATAPAAERATCRDGLEVNAANLRRLTLRVNPSQLRIAGASGKTVRVRCDLPNELNPDRVTIDWSPSASSATLRVRGGRLSNQKFRLEVPDHLDLYIRIKAGDVTIHGVRGSKDVEMAAGDLKIDLGHPSDYARVDASVWVGDLRASSYRIRKGGFFRSFTRHNSQGKYELRARVGAGQITLE